MGKKNSELWCFIGMNGVILLLVATSDFVFPVIFSVIAVAIYIIKMLTIFFTHGNVTVTFGRLLSAIVIWLVCNILFAVQHRLIRPRLLDKYDIVRMMTYAEGRLKRSDSAIANTIELIECLVLIAVAAAPGLGMCYGLYHVILGSPRATFELILSASALVLLHIIATRICSVAWRKM